MIRRAMSLLEVAIALALFATLIALAIESLSGVQRYVDREQATNDLTLEGQRVLAEISEDLAASGWYIPAAGQRDAPAAGQLAAGTQDRQLRYYPYVCIHSMSSTVGEGSAFAAHNARAGQIVDPMTLPPALPAAHRQASWEVIFVRAATGAVGSAGSAIDFATPPRPIADFTAQRSSTPIDVPSPAVDVSVQSGRVVALPVKWDAVAGADPAWQRVREHSYVVLPDPDSGRGRLVRMARDGASNDSSAALREDHVVSRHVDRIVFHTCRTNGDLAVSQIGVTAYLSTALPDGSFATARVEGTVCMRALSNPASELVTRRQLGAVVVAPGP